MGNAMLKILFSALVCTVLAAAPGVTLAEDAPQGSKKEQKAVRIVNRVVYVDAKANTIVVTTYSDGTFDVTVNGSAPMYGAAATEALAGSGISFNVDPQGRIVDQQLADGVKVQAPSSADSSAAGAGVRSSAPVLPANIAIGGGVESARYYEPIGKLSEKSISK